MSFDFRKGLASLSGSVADFGSNLQQNIQPFAQRTRQQLTEKLVGSEDTTGLPAEYVELENQFEEIMPANQALLKILSIYESEGYDYPPNLRDTLSHTYKGMQDRIFGLRQAASAIEASQILMSGTAEGAAQALQEPRTLHHALGRALTTLSETLTGNNKEHISPVLAKVGTAETTIGNSQQVQDREISKVSVALRNLLRQTQNAVSKARRNVHNTRLDLDVKKSSLRHAGPNAANLGSLETEVERAEDEFVAAIEEASTLMKSAISTTSFKPVQAVVQLAKAQREYHRSAAEDLDKLIPQLETQEATARDLAGGH